MTLHYQKIGSSSPADTAPGPIRNGARKSVSQEAFAAQRGGIYRNGAKRLFDILVIVIAAPFVLPIVLLLALLVAFDGGQPFYLQTRVGRSGKLYKMWKLRTMEVDAERKLADHLAADPAARAEWNLNQKLKCDPRITRFGPFLRKSSLDELPQLWNVLRGQMSLVGPRPMMPDQAPLYPGQAYYALRPGITGPWQVSERNRSTFADRARFDTAYEREMSFATDLRLIGATLGVVLKGTGC